MKHWLAVAALVSAGAAQAEPGDMSVATFIAKADALRAKGFMALLSSDYKVLKAEGTAAGLAYRSQLRAERAAGRPSSCPPTPAKVDSNMVMAHLRSYPAAARPRITMKVAMAELFARTWPCK